MGLSLGLNPAVPVDKWAACADLSVGVLTRPV